MTSQARLFTLRPAHQDRSNPVCEGSGIIPVIETAFGTTDVRWCSIPCPVCGHVFTLNRDGRIRKHRRLS